MPHATDIPAPPAAELVRHFRARLAAETDCSDVHATLQARPDAIVVVDTRSPEAFAAGHVPGAVNIPPATMDAETLAAHGDVLFVTYCWGPHCNGATKGAASPKHRASACKALLLERFRELCAALPAEALPEPLRAVGDVRRRSYRELKLAATDYQRRKDAFLGLPAFRDWVHCPPCCEEFS